MTVVRVCYKSGLRFDESYYLNKHLPLAGRIMGALGLKHVEVMKVMATPDGSTPPYQVIFSAYFESPAAQQKAMESPDFAQVLADIPNYYDGMPVVLIGEVVVGG